MIVLGNLVKLVGANIKEIRLQKGWTREELAEKCEVQPSYLAGVERGERNITLHTLENLANGLEETPFTILEFHNLKIDTEYLNKKELMNILVNRINKASEKELNSIIRIIDEILHLKKLD